MTNLFFPGWGIPLEQYSSFIQKHKLTAVDYGYFPEQKTGDYPLFKIPENWPLDTMELVILFRSFFTEKVTLYGHSLGTIYALKLAVLYPHCIDKIILLSPFCTFISNDEFLAHEIEGLHSMQARIHTEPQKVLQAFYRQLFSPERKKIPIPESINIDSLERDLITLETFDVRPLVAILRALNIEVHYATEDNVVPAKFTEDFNQFIIVEPPHVTRHESVGHAFALTSSL